MADLDLPKGRKLHRSFAEAAEENLTRLNEIGGKNVHVHGKHTGAAIGALDTGNLDAITQELHTPAIPEPVERGAVVAISRGKSAA